MILNIILIFYSANELSDWISRVSQLATELNEASEKEMKIEDCKKKWDELQKLIKHTAQMEGRLNTTLPEFIEKIAQTEGTNKEVTDKNKTKLQELVAQIEPLGSLLEKLTTKGK